MKKIKLALSCLVAVAAIGCSSEEYYTPEPAPEQKADTNTNSDKEDDDQPVTENPYTKIILSQGEAEVANAGYEFAWNLFGKVNDERTNENILISPTSVNISLTMLLNGADGATRSEMIQALGLQGMSVDDINKNSRFLASTLLNRDNGSKLTIANSLWIDEKMPIKNEYKATLADYFNATAENTTASKFATDVNAWSNTATNGLVPKIMNDREHYDWALLNSIYFQNVWHSSVKFRNTDGSFKDFFNSDGTKGRKLYMDTKTKCLYHESKLAKHAHIPFGNGAYLMSITLPNEGKSIGQCIDELKDAEAFKKGHNEYVRLTMPKFEIMGQLPLTQIIKDLGIVKAFNIATAEFPYVSDIKTFVSTVRQGYSFHVNEKGAIAAATTADASVATSPSHTTHQMMVNRPFIFTIYEQSTGCILFMGKIEKF